MFPLSRRLARREGRLEDQRRLRVPPASRRPEGPPTNKRAVVAVTLALLTACGSSPAPISARAAQSPQQFSSVDQLLAPIALYPDQLLAQILLSASEPAKITELDTWMQNNSHMKAPSCRTPR
jgi:hypothetical protein